MKMREDQRRNDKTAGEENPAPGEGEEARQRRGVRVKERRRVDTQRRLARNQFAERKKRDEEDYGDYVVLGGAAQGTRTRSAFVSTLNFAGVLPRLWPSMSSCCLGLVLICILQAEK